MADSRRRLSADEQATIIEMYQSEQDGDWQYGLADIEQQVGVSRAAIYSLLDRRGIPRRTRTTQPPNNGTGKLVGNYDMRSPMSIPVELSQLPGEVWERVAEQIVPYLFDELYRLRVENEQLRDQLGEG